MTDSTPSHSAREIPRISYAQNHEDILIDRLFPGRIGTFMDIGACHPVVNSNTRFFYERGWGWSRAEFLIVPALSRPSARRPEPELGDL